MTTEHSPGSNTKSRDALEAIREVTETVHRFLDFDIVAERAIDGILSYKPFAAASIMVLDDPGTHFILVCSKGFPEKIARTEIRIPVEGSLMGLAIREGRVILSEDLAKDPRGFERTRKSLVAEGFRSALLVPLIHGEQPLGSLNVALRANHMLTREESDILLSIGHTVALALANAKHVETLRVNDQRYAMATAAGRVGVWDWDLESGKFYVDANVKALLGYSDDEIPNDLEAWSQHIHPEDADSVGNAIEEYLTAGSGAFLCEHRMVHKDGSIRWILARGEAIRGRAGKVVRMVGTDVDITERKQFAEQQHALQEQLLHAEKLKSLGVMAGGIAHDFNNLLTTILGNAGLVLPRVAEDSPLRPAIQQIETAARRASELTKQLLAYSGRGALEIEAIDLSRLVEEMTALLKVSISKKAELEYSFADDLPLIEADPTQVRQVVMNLITNASDALEGGRGRIRVRTGVAGGPSAGESDVRVPGARLVFVEVSDDGCGMNEEVRSRIFDPFFSTKLEGRGLGLAAVRGIVQGHRGMLRVSSEPGKGTIVTVLLPAAEGVLAIPAEPLGRDTARLSGGTVLVADDESGVRTLAKTILEGAGFDVLEARDGMDAVERFSERAGEIRLVLLDLTMPGMAGHEALERIREIRRDVHVILSSGYPRGATLHEYSWSGPVSFLPKPYDPPALMAVVRRALLG